MTHPFARDMDGKRRAFWVRYIYLGAGEERLSWNGQHYLHQVLSENGKVWETIDRRLPDFLDDLIKDAWTFLVTASGAIKVYDVIYTRGENERTS